MPPLGATAGRRRGSKTGVLILTAAAVLAGVAALVSTGRRADERGQLEVRPLTFRPGSIMAARFAPDGRTVHYSAAWGGRELEVFSTTVDSPEARPLGIGAANLLAVSLSGELAVALQPNMGTADRAPGTLARVQALGSAPRQLANGVEYADWAPDGQRLAVVRWEGGQNRLEFPLGTVLFRSSGWVSHPRVSPGGDKVAFIDHDGPNDTRGQVRVIDKDGKVEIWSPLFDPAMGLAWAPGGKELLFSAAARTGEVMSLWVLGPKQSPRLLYRAPGDLVLADASPDGRLLVLAVEWRTHVELWTSEGRNQRPEGTLGYTLPVGVSDDGSKVLMYEEGPGLGGFPSLWDRRNASATRLGKGRPLALSHDGQWTLVEDEPLSGKLLLLPTGAGSPKGVGDSGLAYIRAASFFADGRRVALLGRARKDGPNQVWLLELDGGPARPISTESVFNWPTVHVSPDQRWVAVNGPTGLVTAYSVEGAEPIRVEAWGRTHLVAGWLADGSLLAYERARVPSRVERFEPRSGTIGAFATVAPTDATGVRSVRRIMPALDGRTMAFNVETNTGTLWLLDWKR